MTQTAYDAIAAFYDQDMGRNASGEDILFYKQRCAEGPVLELACGTGRITLPLVQAGLNVVGMDTSRAMLRELRRKAKIQLTASERARLQVTRMDMRKLAFLPRFARILCPFSAFFYLLDATAQQAALRGIRASLAPGGQFLLDVFIPNPQVEQPGQRIFDYERPLDEGGFLQRHKTIAPTANPRVNLITRHYRFLDENRREIRTLTTEHRIHPHAPEELQALLSQSGFVVEEAWGDFRQPEVADNTRTVAMVCRPIESNPA